MRQVFSSARLENVERVARMLEDAGIEVRITDGRSFKKGIRGDFSYRDQAGERKPAAWIVRSEDQPRARAMLREAGLMESGRSAPASFIATGVRGEDAEPRADGGRRRAFRIKIGLLLVIAAVVTLAWMHLRTTTTTPSNRTASITPAPAPLAKVPEDLPAAGNTPTPDSLALALLGSELPTRTGAVLCLAIDGHDPRPALLAALPPTPGTVLPVSRCPAAIAGKDALPPQIIAIGKYEANAKGTGTVFMNRRRVGGHGVPQWYDVRREGEGWRIIQPL